MLKYRMIACTPALLAEAAERLALPTDAEMEFERKRQAVIMAEHKQVMREARRQRKARSVDAGELGAQMARLLDNRIDVGAVGAAMLDLLH
jgi:hypothetical protein